MEVIGLDLLSLEGKEILMVDVLCDSGLSTEILLEKINVFTIIEHIYNWLLDQISKILTGANSTC